MNDLLARDFDNSYMLNRVNQAFIKTYTTHYSSNQIAGFDKAHEEKTRRKFA